MGLTIEKKKIHVVLRKKKLLPIANKHRIKILKKEINMIDPRPKKF